MKFYLLFALLISMTVIAAEKKKDDSLKINGGESSMVKNAKAMKEKHKKTQAQLDEVDEDSDEEESEDTGEEE